MADLFSLQQNNQQPYFNSLYLTTPLFKKPQGIDNVFGNTQTQNVPEIKNESVFSTASKSETPQTQKEDSKIDGLATEIKGYYVLTEDAAKKRLATQLSEAKTPEAQQKEFERLVAAGMSKRDASILAGTLGSLNKGIQVSATQTMLDNKNLTPAIKTHSDNQVAKNIHTLATENQVAGFNLVMDKTKKETQIIMAGDCYKMSDKKTRMACNDRVIKTNDVDIINAGASTASKYSAEESTEVVARYQQTDLKPEQQKQIDKTLISQYGEYAKESQVDIHKIMSASKYSETVELAASNIYKFDKTNQTPAFQVTMDTKNEAAVKAASAQYSKYDDSVKADIKTMVQNSQYESAKTALAQAEQEAQVKAQKEADAKTATESKTEATKTSTATNQKIEDIKTQIAKKTNTASLEKSIIKLNPSEQISLLRQCPNDSNIIKILLQNNPSMDVLAEIEATLKNNGDAVDYKTLLPQLCFLSSNMQSSVLTKSAANNDLGLISKTTLNSNIRLEYDKLVNRQEKTGQLGLG